MTEQTVEEVKYIGLTIARYEGDIKMRKWVPYLMATRESLTLRLFTELSKKSGKPIEEDTIPIPVIIQLIEIVENEEAIRIHFQTDKRCALPPHVIHGEYNAVFDFQGISHGEPNFMLDPNRPR